MNDAYVRYVADYRREKGPIENRIIKEWELVGEGLKMLRKNAYENITGNVYIPTENTQQTILGKIVSEVMKEAPGAITFGKMAGTAYGLYKYHDEGIFEAFTAAGVLSWTTAGVAALAVLGERAFRKKLPQTYIFATEALPKP